MIVGYKNIIGLTTDPMDTLRGYSLVFFRIFDYIEKNYKEINTKLISNEGKSSEIVKNPNFFLIKIDNNLALIKKTLFLVNYMVKNTKKYNVSDTVLLINSEIPELISGIILKFLFGYNVFSIVHDFRIRNSSLSTILISKVRYILLFLIGKLIFVNKFSYESVWWVSKKNKYLIGNPIFQ
jgi:hypothetical protein